MFIKICGITTEEDALFAVAVGADAVGFLFAPSTRQLQPVQARDIVRRLPHDVMSVGVFRDENAKRVVEIAHQVGLKAVQLHGHETPEDCRYVRRHVPFVIKAFVAGSRELDRFDDYGADAAHIESDTPGAGKVFDWSLAEGAPEHRKVILAGGLNPKNVRAAIERVQPWGVDVSSGVEKSPGKKDPVLVRQFIERAREAEKLPYRGPIHAPYDWKEEQ